MPKLLFSIILLSMFYSNAQEHIDVQGHRGARGLLPENSIPAFLKAIDLGVTTLELDVVVSKDKKVVVSHEPYMNHHICSAPDDRIINTGNEKDFNLYAMEYEMIKTFDCGIKGNPRFKEQVPRKTYKPLLSEVIEVAELKSDDILYNVEIKSNPSYDGIYTPEVSEFVSLVVDVIEEKGVMEKVTLQSFDIRALEEIHKLNPEIRTALLVDGSENINVKLNGLSFKPDIVSPYFKLLNKSIVRDLQSEGYKTIPWTVNNIEDLKVMISIKVDGIITDYPDRLLNILHRK